MKEGEVEERRGDRGIGEERNVRGMGEKRPGGEREVCTWSQIAGSFKHS